MITIQRRDMSTVPERYETKPDLDYENTWRIVREENPGKLYLGDTNWITVKREWQELKRIHGKVNAAVYGHMYNHRFGDVDLHDNRLVSVNDGKFNVVVDGKRRSLYSLRIDVVFTWEAV